MEISKTLSDLDEKILKNDLLDIQRWVDGAIAGKINNCKKRMLAEWQPKLLADPEVETLPATEEGLINLIVVRADYKDRAARDAESQEA